MKNEEKIAEVLLLMADMNEVQQRMFIHYVKFWKEQETERRRVS